MTLRTHCTFAVLAAALFAGVSRAGAAAHALDADGFDSRTGKNLWRYSTGTPIWGAAPMTYMFDGRQFVLVVFTEATTASIQSAQARRRV